ncbi:MAG: phytoene desaturase family protein [Bacteroidota bacterium]
MAYFFQEDERKIRDFFADSQFIYETTAPIFMQRPLAWKHLCKTSAFWKGILRLPLLPLRGTLIKQLKKYFKNKKTIQYFSRYATYNGSSPFATPAMMQLMPHVEQGIGAYLPEKGMYSISNSLMHLAIRQGAKFHFESKVTALKLNRNRVEAIQFQNEQWSNLNEHDVVISNMDVHGTYRQLIKDFPAPEKWLNQEKSSSALIFYWGMNRKFDQLDVHNIFFSDCYEDEFDHLFNKKDLAQDLTVYVHITSKLIPNDAPNSGENWFVMVNAPHVNGQNWQEEELKAREQIIKKLSQILKVEIENHICCERIWNPEGIQTDTSSYLGALYGNASNSAYSAFQRHANVNSSILGLYFAGGSVHPGGGVPLAMLSAKMIEHHILAHE